MRQTSGWVTCAKPSRRDTGPRVSHTFCRRFLKQNCPKNISDVPSKILEKKEHNYQTNLVPRVEENPGNEVGIRLEFCDLPEIGCPVVKVENLYCQFFTSFTELILADF